MQVIEASCHCGSVKFCVQTPPLDVNACNCSICRRYGVLWAYYRPSEVEFFGDGQPTDIYMWGDRDLEFHRCHVCGCVTHWSSVDPTYDRMAVNARLMPPEVLAGVPVRRGDGASI